MIKLTVGRNDAEQRLDRFLRKYLKNASLGRIYKIIRKDVRINGSRAGIHNETIIKEGDELSLYINDEELLRYTGKSGAHAPGSGLGSGGREAMSKHGSHSVPDIVYEDENILAVTKPYGLLTHGDGREKKRTLVNQAVDYLIAKGEYIPRIEHSFTPAAVNRLDRNTTGIVLFGKNAASLRALNAMIRDKDAVSKYYITVLCGELSEELQLEGELVKDEARNIVTVTGTRDKSGAELQNPPARRTGAAARRIMTIARPLVSRGGFTLAEIELVTGRTHQIRAHMASAGFHVLGDTKYGDPVQNRLAAQRYGLKAQLLHARRLVINKPQPPLEQLKDKEFNSPLPKQAADVCMDIFGDIAQYIR